MRPSIDEIVARVPGWHTAEVRITPLPGGITNANYRVDTGGRSFVVRVPGESTELLSIDRDNELCNTRIAAQLGVGPRVEHHVPEWDVMVLEFLGGKVLSIEALHRPGAPGRLGEVIARLHRGPEFRKVFDMPAIAAGYLQTARRLEAALPADIAPRWRQFETVVDSLARHPLPRVPCHNDLLAANVIDCDGVLRIIDYEYSGNNDPCFELGNAAQEQEYSTAQVQELCAARFGQASAELIGRVMLNMIVSDVGWSLWAAVQSRISRLDFDFQAYGAGRWKRAMAKLDATELDDWQQAARCRLPSIG